MKKLSLAVLCAVLFVGCAGFGSVPPANPVCPQDDSWICAQSEKIGVQPETVYGWIYDAAAIAAISDVIKIKEICNFESKIADWYVEAYPISYDTFIDEILLQANSLDAQKAILIKNILSRHLVQYRNVLLITGDDDIILRKGDSAFRRDFLCGD